MNAPHVQIRESVLPAEAYSTMLEDKLVLVTGGTGMIGTHLVEQLLERKAKVRTILHRNPPAITDDRIEFIPGDLTNMEDCVRAVKGVDYVIHSAAVSLGADATEKNPMQLITPNVRMNMQMLEAACKENVDRFAVISSSVVYPPYEHPMKEEEGFVDNPFRKYFGIGWVKRFTELMAKFYFDDYGLKVAIIRPSNTYGRYDDFDFGTSHVLPALIRRAVEGQDPYVVWGDGEDIRDFIHVDDLTRGILMALENYAVGEAINIGTGVDARLKDLVPLILRLSGLKAQVQYDVTKPTMIPVRRLDVTKAREKLGFVPRVSLEEGLKDTIEWYRASRFSRVRGGSP